MVRLVLRSATFAAADVDQSGKLSYAEFAKMVEGLAAATAGDKPPFLSPRNVWLAFITSFFELGGCSAPALCAATRSSWCFQIAAQRRPQLKSWAGRGHLVLAANIHSCHLLSDCSIGVRI